MKITLIRQDSGSGKEALSICEAGTLFNKMKTETKSGHITALRNLIPMLEGTYSQYEHIDKLPYIYSAVECTRTKEGERKMKQYNGLVQLEVNRPGRPVRNGICETAGGTLASDFRRILWFQWP